MAPLVRIAVLTLAILQLSQSTPVERGHTVSLIKYGFKNVYKN
jgi:hypothetical protein